jgi:hypothetical protein
MKMGDHVTENIEAISSGSLGLDVALGVGGILEVESSKFTVLNLQEKLRLPYTPLPNAKRLEELRPLSMLNTLSIAITPRAWV